jgi:hypothetical protein
MWLLVAQFGVIAPHITRLPWVVVVGWLLAAGWRTAIFQGRAPFPHVLIKILLVAVCLAGIRQTYGSWIGLEPSVALLITCFSFKLLESKSRREAYLLVFLGYFVALTEFLFRTGTRHHAVHAVADRVADDRAAGIASARTAAFRLATLARRCGDGSAGGAADAAAVSWCFRASHRCGRCRCRGRRRKPA